MVLMELSKKKLTAIMAAVTAVVVAIVELINQIS